MLPNPRFILALSLVATNAKALAVSVAPGDTVQLLGMGNSPKGTIVAQSTQAFDQSADPFTLRTTVIKEDNTGNTDFAYALTFPTSESNFESFIQASASGFTGVDVDADYLIGSGTYQYPQSISRTLDGESLAFIDWVTGTGLPVATLIVRTDATAYAQDTPFTIGYAVEQPPPTGIPPGGAIVFEDVQTYGPSAAFVPEPSSALLLLSGIVAFVAQPRRRK